MAKDDVLVGSEAPTNADKGLNDDDKALETEASITGVEDAAALPKGTIDPVYEAKARVLNHAV